MNLYLAPMEEITGYVYRNTLDKCFGGVDKYFTPFVTPNQNKFLKTKDGREIIPEHNEGLNVVPQILTNNAEHFLELLVLMASLGYREYNFNFGCPSNTVVKKYKGSGILRDLDLLDSFLDSVFSGVQKEDFKFALEKSKVNPSEFLSNVRFSVKTRVGYQDDDDIEDILKIYNNYPIVELIVHPRIQKEFYSGLPRMQVFDYIYNNAKMPVCYNGNIFSKDDYEKIVSSYPMLTAVMIGRGAVSFPDIFINIKNNDKADLTKLKDFHKSLFSLYEQEFGTNDAICKMKEFWFYFKDNFTDIEKPYKELKKSKEKAEYNGAVNEIFGKAFLNNKINFYL